MLGYETLGIIAQELVRAGRHNVKLDWTKRVKVRTEMQVMRKRILRRHGYLPDKQPRVTALVWEQAEALCQEGERNNGFCMNPPPG